jgi:hypothetical protein
MQITPRLKAASSRQRIEEIPDMAKKSAARHHSAARRPQTTSKQATLVRAPDATGSSVATAENENAVATITEATLKAATTTSTAVKPAARPQAQTKPATAKTASSAKPGATRADASRVARAQATKSARAAHLISASNYAYVLHDLRLTGILAAIMLIGMIVLKFVMR